MAEIFTNKWLNQFNGSRLRRRTTKLDEGGKFEDEDDLEEKYKEKPHILDNIKANAASMTDPVRLVKMFYVPKYSVQLSKENSLTEGSKRKLESETTVRKAAVPSKKSSGDWGWRASC